MTEMTKKGANKALFLSTMGFAVSFAVWGLLAALAPFFKELYSLTDTEKSIMIAVPVLLGSVGRFATGMLADRFGGRNVFSALLLFSALPTIAIGLSTSYSQLLFFGLFLGLAGTTFPVGVGFTARWFSPEKQGAALGVYGMGNIGQSVAVFFAPVVAAYFGNWRLVFFIFAALAVLWAAVFFFAAENDKSSARPRSVVEALAPLRTSKVAWILSLFYFLTFGGFVALALYMPTFLRELFHLEPADAGARTAGFIILATLMRPLGGILADKFGGARVLLPVFAAIAVLAIFLSIISIAFFTVGALGIAAALGLGNGAVFKLVPEYFPKETGTVTGLVGAFGGLGGFFPPIELGLIKDIMESYEIGFILLSVFAIGCFVVNYYSFLRKGNTVAGTVAV